MGRYCRGLQLSASSLRDLEELSAEAKKAGAGDTVLRIRGLIMVSRNHSYREVGACLGVAFSTVSNWVNNYLDDGYEALMTKPDPGRPAEMSEEEFSLLDDLVDAGAVASGFPNNVWDARRVAMIIRSHFGVRYHPNHVAKILHAKSDHRRMRQKSNHGTHGKKTRNSRKYNRPSANSASTFPCVPWLLFQFTMCTNLVRTDLEISACKSHKGYWRWLMRRRNITGKPRPDGRLRAWHGQDARRSFLRMK